MAKHLYAETLLTPGLGIPFQWRYGGSESDLLSLMDRESPVYGALEQSINRFDYTTFDLALNKPTLIEWANSQSELQDAADIRELRLGAAHVFQQSIELLQGMQMMTSREDDPSRLAFIHHNIGDVMGLIGQRSGSLHFLEQAALSYEQALELRTQDETPVDWAETKLNYGVIIHTIGVLEDDSRMLKDALDTYKSAINFIDRNEDPQTWACAMSNIEWSFVS